MKPITTTAKFFLVQKLQISNKEALSVIAAKKMLINGKPAGVLQKIGPADEVRLNNEILKLPKTLFYFAYYKPRGVECTLNKDLPDNLCSFINLPDNVVPAGRLDKESEGLLFLTNDGYLIQNIIHKENVQEKEYIVSVDKPLTPEALNSLRSGVKIMGQMTLPAKVEQINPFTFNIILTQGLNRQIRRMCHKLNYEVTQLKRIRIVNLKLDNLASGEMRSLTDEEISAMKEITEKLKV